MKGEIYVSFADGLTQKSNSSKIEYSDDLYVRCIISAIKNECRYANAHGNHSIKGYLSKKLDTEYTADYSCYMVSSVKSKKELSSYARQSLSVNTVYYPYDPRAKWDGPLFDLKDSTINRIKSAFYELGFTNSKISFNRIEVEKGTKGLMHILTFTKTGEKGYLIYVEINW